MISGPVDAVVRGVDRTLGRVLRAVLTGLIVGYQRLLSPMLGPRCRFYPSCSSYALEAVRVHGAAKGTVLATARVCRCHPWTPGGVDQVPAKGRWTSDPYVSLESTTLESTSLEPTNLEPTSGDAGTADDRSAA